VELTGNIRVERRMEMAAGGREVTSSFARCRCELSSWLPFAAAKRRRSQTNRLQPICTGWPQKM